jgi:hypothetical protein
MTFGKGDKTGTDESFLARKPDYAEIIIQSIEISRIAEVDRRMVAKGGQISWPNRSCSHYMGETTRKLRHV